MWLFDMFDSNFGFILIVYSTSLLTSDSWTSDSKIPEISRHSRSTLALFFDHYAHLSGTMLSFGLTSKSLDNPNTCS